MPMLPAAPALRRQALALALAAGLAGCVPVTLPAGQGPGQGQAQGALAGAWPVSSRCAAAEDAGPQAAAVLAGVNAARAEAGLAPVRLDASLTAAAQHQACDNAARQSLDHTGSDGASLATRLARSGISFSLAAENTGLGYADAARAVAGWMGSAPHRANILRPEVRIIGLGLARPAGQRPTWVLDLVAPGQV